MRYLSNEAIRDEILDGIHKDREENLSAAKNSLKKHRKAYMHRRTDLSGDVIDIIDDGKIIVNCSQIV